MSIKQVYAYYDQQTAPAAEGFRCCPYCRADLLRMESGQKLRPTCPECGFVQFTNPSPAISIVILQGENVLLGQRRGHPGAGQWAIPSGYIEFEDDFLTTAIREAKEETGLDVRIDSILNVVSSFFSPRFHFLSLYVTAHVGGGSLSAGDDLAAVAWYPLSGPLPELAFQEDIDMLAWYRDNRTQGLPVDPAFARPR
jgi:8-oxo-dGTP diphosphatase